MPLFDGTFFELLSRALLLDFTELFENLTVRNQALGGDESLYNVVILDPVEEHSGLIQRIAQQDRFAIDLVGEEAHPEDICKLPVPCSPVGSTKVQKEIGRLSVRCKPLYCMEGELVSVGH